MCVQRAGTYQSEHIPHPFIPFRIIQVLMQKLGSVQSLLLGRKFGLFFSVLALCRLLTNEKLSYFVCLDSVSFF